MANDQQPDFTRVVLESVGLAFLALVVGSFIFGTATHDYQVGLGMALMSLIFSGPVCVVLFYIPLMVAFYVISRLALFTLVHFLILGAGGGALIGFLGSLVFGPGLRRYTSGIPSSALELTLMGLAMGFVFAALFAWRYRVAQQLVQRNGPDVPPL